MGRYADFETTRDLYRGLLTTVSVANRAGGPDEAFVVKVYDPGGAVADKAGVERESELFLERAEAMDAMTREGARYWLAVHGFGRTEGGAFYVADRCPRTVEQLINGRVKLDGPGMLNVLGSVWEGLRELQRVKGRPHGALKPTNVLLDRVGQVDKARVLLADPAPLTGLDVGEAELDDIRALGRLVFQLVFFQPFRERGGHPIAESTEFAKLGKKSEEWRSFCNLVLDPSVRPGQLTLEGLSGSIDALREGRSGGAGKLPIVPLGVTAAAVTIVAVGGYTLFTQMFAENNNEPTETVDRDPERETAPAVEFSETRWARWCEKHAEFRELAGLLLAQRELLRSDPFLERRVLPDLEQRDGRLSPNVVRGDSHRARGVVLPGDPVPEGAKTEEGVRLMAEAMAVLENYPGAFGSHEWAARSDVDRLAERMSELGLRASASVMGGWLHLASASDSGASERTGAIFSIARASAYLARLDAALDRLERAASRLEASGDERIAVALTMARLADEGLVDEGGGRLEGVARLERLAEELDRQDGAVSRLVSYIESEHGGRVPEAFVGQSQSGVRLAVLQDRDEPDPVEWEQALRRYFIEFERWRPAEDRLVRSPVGDRWLSEIGERIEAARAELREVEDELALGEASFRAAGELDSEQRRDYTEQIETLFGRLDDLDDQRAALSGRTGEIPQSESAEIVGLMDGIESEVGGVALRVAAIRRDLLRSTIDAEAIIADLRERTGVQGVVSRSVNRVFVEAREALIARYRSDGDAAALQSDASRLDEVLLRIDALSREALPRVQERPASTRQEAWDGLIDGLSERLAGELVDEAEIAQQIAKGDGVPRPTRDDLRASPAFVNASGEAERLVKIASDAAALEASIESALPLDDGGVAPSMRWFAELRRSAEWDGLEPALGPVAERVDRLRAVSSTDDHARLLESASDTTDLPMAMASWRRLADIAPIAASLGAEADALADLRQAIDLIDNGDVAVGLDAELQSIGRARWKRALADASSRSELSDGLRLAGRFGVDPDAAELPDRVRYNIELLRFQEAWRQRAETPDDAWVTERAAAFVARVEGLRLGEQQRAYIAEIADVGQGRAESGTDYSRVGPGLEGWTPEPLGDGVVRYVSPWDAGVSAEFARIQSLSEGDEVVYLARHEVSIGLFSLVVSRTGAWDRISERWQEDPIERHENRVQRGHNARILSYRYNDVTRELAPTTSWLPDFERHFGDLDLYPQGRRPESPTPEHPMHAVSVIAAERFAALMGCRLPTDVEWRAALDDERRSGESGANLRDASWRRQHERIRQLEDEKRFGDVPPPWPDIGAFRPPGMRVAVGPDASAAVETDDGSIWFDRVDRQDRGRRFAHLVGNVAEFVTATTLPAEYGVVGGSALSPAEVEAERVHGTPPFLVESAYADVGFRMAFTASGEALQRSPADHLARLIERAEFAFGG